MREIVDNLMASYWKVMLRWYLTSILFWEVFTSGNIEWMHLQCTFLARKFKRKVKNAVSKNEEFRRIREIWDQIGQIGLKMGKIGLKMGKIGLKMAKLD